MSIISIAMAYFLLAGSGQMVIESRISEGAAVGDCSDGNRRFDLSKSLTILEKSGFVRGHLGVFVELSGEDVLVYESKDEGGFVKTSIPFFLNGKNDIDISLNFILIEGVVYVYWRETYQHRIYKQGVVGLNDDGGVYTVCSGLGGVENYS